MGDNKHPLIAFPFSKQYQCLHCGALEGHRSRRRTFREKYFLRLFLLRPVRCADCFRRRYVSLWVHVRSSKKSSSYFARRTPVQSPVTNDSPAIVAEAKTRDLLERPGGPAKLAQALSAARQNDPRATLVTAQIIAESAEKDPKALETRMQQLIDSVAAEHFSAGDVKQSLEIAKLSALAYPNSAMAFALLAQAYASEGEKDPARQNAQKALELLPSDKFYGQDVRDGIKEDIDDILKQ